MMMMRVLLFLFLLFTTNCCCCLAFQKASSSSPSFVPPPPPPGIQRRGHYHDRTKRTFASSSSSSSSLEVLVFDGTEGADSGDNNRIPWLYDYTDNDHHHRHHHRRHRHHHDDWLRQYFLSDGIATLARLASAFASPDYPVTLEQIHSVNLVDIDKSHVDIEAVVCDDDDAHGMCLSILVPIAFPHPCNSDDDEECMLHQVMTELDTQAQQRLSSLKQMMMIGNQQQHQHQQQQQHDDYENQNQQNQNQQHGSCGGYYQY